MTPWQVYVLGGPVPREWPPRWVVLLVLAVVLLVGMALTAALVVADYFNFEPVRP